MKTVKLKPGQSVNVSGTVYWNYSDFPCQTRLAAPTVVYTHPTRTVGFPPGTWVNPCGAKNLTIVALAR